MKKFLFAMHRELGFFFAGLICIYAISGIAMNHRSSFDPSYCVEITDFSLPPGFPQSPEAVGAADIESLLGIAGQEGGYSKHYFSGPRLKVLIKGGSSITADLDSRHAVHEKVSRRIVLGSMVAMHYNPGRWWTWLSDAFAISLILITLSGMAIVGGRKGLLGRGGLLFLAGLAIPLLIL